MAARTAQAFRSGFTSPRNFNNGKSLRGARKGDAAISLYKSEIASPAARNDIMAKGVTNTYETASNHQPQILNRSEARTGPENGDVMRSTREEMLERVFEHLRNIIMAEGILSPHIVHGGTGHFKRVGWHYMAFPRPKLPNGKTWPGYSGTSRQKDSRLCANCGSWVRRLGIRWNVG